MTVRELNKNDIINIIINLKYTRHSIDRIKERLLIEDLRKINYLIYTSNFGFMFNNDINIKIGNTENYFVITKNNNDYVMITIKRLSYGGKTLKEKYELRKIFDNKK